MASVVRFIFLLPPAGGIDALAPLCVLIYDRKADSMARHAYLPNHHAIIHPFKPNARAV
jgi:hypothetical protein